MGEQPVRHFGDNPGAAHSPATDGDVFDPPRPGELDGLSPLELLQKAVDGEVSLDPVTLKVKERAGVAVTYDTNIDDDMLAVWKKRSVRQDPRDGVSAIKLASIILAAQSIGFSINGQQVTSFGHPFTFASNEVWAMVTPPALSAPEAVKRLIGPDAHVIQTAEELMQAAGYTGLMIEREDQDPTVAPSRS